MSTMFDHISLTNHGNYATIRLEEPERLNAMTYKMIGEIADAFDEAARMDGVHAIVLRGAGRAFCAGDNLKGLGPTEERDDLYLRLKNVAWPMLVQKMRTLYMPIIVAAHGHTLGAGLEMFMAGDIRIATEDAQLGIPFVKLGLTGGTYNLPRYVGFTKAAAMLLTGEPISGADGYKHDLVTALVKDEGELDAEIAKWVTKFVNVSPETVGLMKRTMYRAFELSHDQAIEAHTLTFMTAVNSPNFKKRMEERWRKSTASKDGADK